MTTKLLAALVATALGILLFLGGCAEDKLVTEIIATVPISSTQSATKPTDEFQPQKAEPVSRIPIVSNDALLLLKTKMSNYNGNAGITLYDFALIFGEECIRNSQNQNGVYAALQLRNGNKIFVFFDYNGEATYMKEVVPFLTQAEFLDCILGNHVTLGKAAEFYNNVLWSSASSFPAGYFYVEEGVFVLEFSYATHDIINVHFYSNQKMFTVNLPGMYYILQKDKQ